MLFIVGFILFFIFLIVWIRRILSRRFILNCFKDGNVLVCGLRGRGKDMLFNWVIHKRRMSYISNVFFGGKRVDLFDDKYLKQLQFKPFDPVDDFSVGGNTSDNFIQNMLFPYKYPYPDGIDYYVSDSGIYFPSHLHSSLDKRYKSIPVFQAISRHLGACNVHCNVQNVNRLWDKIREQFDIYIQCRDCRVLFGKFVRLRTYVYDKYQSCVDRVKPMKRRLGKNARIEYDKFTGNYGTIKKCTLHFKLPFKYDDRVFKKMLELGDVTSAYDIESEV